MKKNLENVLLSLFFHSCFYASNDSEKATKKTNIPMYKVVLENNSINPIIEKDTIEQQTKIDDQTKKKRLFNKKNKYLY